MDNVEKHLMGRHDQKTHARGAHKGLGRTPASNDPLRNKKTMHLYNDLMDLQFDLYEKKRSGELSREQYQAELEKYRTSPEVKEYTRRLFRNMAVGYGTLVAGSLAAGAVSGLDIDAKGAVENVKNARMKRKTDRAFRSIVNNDELLLNLGRNLGDLGEFGKHLLGRHEQDDHNPNRKRNPRLAEAKVEHRRKDHRTKAEAERLKAKGRRITRAVRDVTGMGMAPFIAMTVGGIMDGQDVDTAVANASKPYKAIANAVGDKAKQTFGKADTEMDVEEVIKAFDVMGIETEYVYGEFVKHLVGRHDQKNHSRKDHRSGEGAATGAAMGALYGGMIGGGRGAVMGSTPKKKAVGAVLGGLMGAGNGALAGGAVGGALGAHALKPAAKSKKAKSTKPSDDEMNQLLFLESRDDLGPDATEEDYKRAMKDYDPNKKYEVKKADVDVTVAGEFSKFDDDKRVAFGWASITDIDGEPVVDRQGDVIKIDDLEEAAYAYVLESRVGGEMHRKEIQKGVKMGPRKVATLVESMVFTPEKVEKMGLPPGSIPNGWWVGFKVDDESVWGKVKKGDYAGFSIHGMGKRLSKSLDEIKKNDEVDMSHEEIVELAKRLHAAGVTSEDVSKHLIGTHDQKNHSRKQHGTKADNSRLSDTQRANRAGLGAVVLPAGISAARNTSWLSEDNSARRKRDAKEDKNFFPDGHTTGYAAGGGAIAGGLKGIVRGTGGTGGAVVGGALAAGAARLGDAQRDKVVEDKKKKKVKKADEVEKHLMGRHDQNNHRRGDHKGMKADIKAGKKVVVTDRKGKKVTRNATPKDLVASVDDKKGVYARASGGRSYQLTGGKEDGGYSTFTSGVNGQNRGSRLTERNAESTKRKNRNLLLAGGGIMAAGAAAHVLKADRRLEILSSLEDEVGKADLSAFDTLIESVVELRKSGSIGRELDFPIQEEAYAEISKKLGDEDAADRVYDQLGGEWAPFENYLSELSKAISEEDEERVEDLLNLL